MKRGGSYAGFSNPFLAWGELAIKSSEMMMASALVIDHRTKRMNAAGSTPNARTRREFGRMRDEKIKAAGQSVQEMTTQMLTIDPMVGVRVYRQMLAVTTAAMSLAGSRTVNQFVERQVRLMRALNSSIAPASDFSDATARVLQRGLNPIHSRATANARRLGK